MSENTLITNLQSARTKVKWWLIGSSIIALVVHYIIETTFVDYSYGTVKDKTPLILYMMLGVSYLTSLCLGLLTIPRWYSLFALAAVVFILFSTAGR